MRRAPAVLAAALLLAACDSSSAEDGTGAGPSSSPPSDGNPVLAADFPDPDVLLVDGTYYAYATNSASVNVQVATSADLTSWQLSATDALPELPSWVVPGRTWAPEVTQFGPDRFVLYATAASADPALQCLAAATATSPAGPFTVAGDDMLVCPVHQSGAVDAATFLDDDGTRYLLWTTGGSCCGLPTSVQIAPLSADGLSLDGDVTQVLQADQDWEGGIVAAPTLVRRDGRYVLLFSANDFRGDRYAIGYATADAVTGPYTAAPAPLLSTRSSGGRFSGPGGQDVVVAPDGSDRLVFHSWDDGTTTRGMDVLPLTWDDGRPVLPTG